MSTTTESIDYNTDAKDKLAKCGGTLKILLLDTKFPPWADEDSAYRPHYRCTLKGEGGSYTFDFWGSIRDGETHRFATAYDVLACLEWYTPEDFADFAAEFGYHLDSMKAHKIWKACLAQTRALHRVFPAESTQQCLAEIR